MPFDYKTGSYYSEGNYVNDFLDGDIMDIDLKKKTVYYGASVAGKYTGKAYFFNANNTMYAGDYLSGKFTGNGFKLENTGRCLTGTWDNGILQKATAIITATGESISPAPKTIAEALNIAIKTFPDTFDDITGELSDDDDWGALFDEDSDGDLYKSLIAFPGAITEDVISLDFGKNNFYTALFLETTDGAKAKAKYNELAKQLAAASITNNILKATVKLKGTVITPDLSTDKTETIFSLQTDKSEYENFSVRLLLSKDADEKYTVSIKIGEEENK